MSFLLSLAYLFFIGSVLGWVLELFFRRFISAENPERKWINPGFCVGPYVPLYGSGLCILYLLASLGDAYAFGSTVEGRAVLFLCMAVSMTAIEYLAGILLLKDFKLRLWDYSMMWGSIQGLICPAFSLIWAAMGALYYFLVHPRVLSALVWLSNNLAFSFVIGYFFGVFTLDVVYSGHLVARIKRYAEENQVVVRYENLKAHIRSVQDQAAARAPFLFPFRTGRNIVEHLKESHPERFHVIESIHRKRKNE